MRRGVWSAAATFILMMCVSSNIISEYTEFTKLLVLFMIYSYRLVTSTTVLPPATSQVSRLHCRPPYIPIKSLEKIKKWGSNLAFKDIYLLGRVRSWIQGGLLLQHNLVRCFSKILYNIFVEQRHLRHGRK